MTMTYGGEDGITVLAESGTDHWTFLAIANDELEREHPTVLVHHIERPAPTWTQAEAIAGGLLDKALAARAVAELPTVRFADIGEVSAAQAVIVDGDMVWVRHPTGGRIPISQHASPEAVAADLQDVLTAWAKLSAAPPK